MNNIKDAYFLKTFPPALKKDEKFLALGKLIAEELHITAREVEKNVIYANMDNLTEYWLDILAYDLHIDWYNYDYPIDAKRAIIKDSVRVHQKLGTRASVERALGGIHPLSEIEEWFDYGGKPYRFRIVLDTTRSRIQADYDEIVKTVDIYKRLTAHLEGLYYQCSMTVVAAPKTEYFLFRMPVTGQSKTGTEPCRNREGVVENEAIKVEPTANGYKTEAVKTGTKPDTNIIFASKDNEVVTDSNAEDYKYSSSWAGKKKAGTTPHVYTVGGISAEDVDTIAEGKAYKFDCDLTGTKPDRNIMFQSEETAAVGETELKTYIFDDAFTGTTLHRNYEFLEDVGKTVIETDMETYSFDTSMTGQITAGTEPSRTVEASSEEEAIAQTADTESYQYFAKRCGSNGLSK